MKNPVDQPIAVVTGGSSGIGRAICETLAENSYLVVNADIRTPETAPASQSVFVECDLRNATAIDKLSLIVSELGSPKVLVLNAGRGIHEKILEGDPEKWADIINLNLMGTLRVLRAVLPFMETGHVVFISSVSAKKTYPYGGVYAATKSAVETIAETLRLEEQPRLRVTVVAAGVVNTSFFENMESGSHSVETIGWGAVEPSDVAAAVLFAIDNPPQAAVNYLTISPPGQPQ